MKTQNILWFVHFLFNWYIFIYLIIINRGKNELSFTLVQVEYESQRGMQPVRYFVRFAFALITPELPFPVTDDVIVIKMDNYGWSRIIIEVKKENGWNIFVSGHRRGNTTQETWINGCDQKGGIISRIGTIAITPNLHNCFHMQKKAILPGDEAMSYNQVSV